MEINENLIFPSSWTLIPVLGTFFTIIAGQKPLLIRIFLMNPVSVWFGLISYPLYLWHWPIISLFQIASGKTLNLFFSISWLLISIILAWLTYILIEKPIRNNLNRKLKTFILCLIMMIIFLSSFFIYKTGSKILPTYKTSPVLLSMR